MTLSLVVAPSHAQAASDRVCSLKLLRRRIDKNDNERLPKLPDSIELGVKRKEAVRLFAAGSSLYRREMGDGTIYRMEEGAQAAADSGRLFGRQWKFLGWARADLKMMRYLFIALDKTHICPPALDELTTAVGKVRDAVEFQPNDATRDSGKRMLAALDPDQVAKIRQAVMKFEPDTGAGFHAWLARRVKRVRAILNKTENPKAKNHLTEDDIHDVRKILQSFLVIYQVRTSFKPVSPADRDLHDYLLFVTEQLGPPDPESSLNGWDHEWGKLKLYENTRKVITDFLDRLEL